MSAIETVDLSQRRDGRYILKNINLKVDRGEAFALIGPSGAGKTTLLRLIDLLDMPASGKIYVNGVDTARSVKDRFKIRRRMAFVLQKPVVFNTSVYDNIACGLKWRGIDKNGAHQRVDQILELSGLPPIKTEMRGLCPVEKCSAWPSPGPWLPGRRYCSSMSRPPILTPSRRRR